MSTLTARSVASANGEDGETMDKIGMTKDVMFVGDYFTLITSVQPEESLRQDGESDDDFAVRVACVLFAEYYGWDVLGASNEVGVVERDGDGTPDGEDEGEDG